MAYWFYVDYDVHIYPLVYERQEGADSSISTSASAYSLQDFISGTPFY